jgi:hypothetical protein
MPRTIERPAAQQHTTRRVTPSIVDLDFAKPFTLDQELEPFGSWVGEPIWVPPKDENPTLAETMLRESHFFTGKEKRWATVVKKHRNDFTHVREFDLFRASIRLPQGKFFVTVTEQENFDKITDTIPACVQTRLDEFLASPAMKRGARVYYLKPLCVEMGDDLLLTTREDLTAAITKVQDEVFAEYRRRALYRRPVQAMTAVANAGLAVPRTVVQYFVKRRQKAIDAYHAHLEFQRRKLALRTARTHQKCRTDGCTFDDILVLTSPLKRTDVIEQYCIEQELSKAKREYLLRLAADMAIGSLPWFIGFSIGGFWATMATLAYATPPIMVCDPAFVAEMPGSKGVLLKIGHFDEVAGVTHVEI